MWPEGFETRGDAAGIEAQKVEADVLLFDDPEADEDAVDSIVVVSEDRDGDRALRGFSSSSEVADVGADPLTHVVRKILPAVHPSHRTAKGLIGTPALLAAAGEQSLEAGPLESTLIGPHSQHRRSARSQPVGDARSPTRGDLSAVWIVSVAWMRPQAHRRLIEVTRLVLHDNRPRDPPEQRMVEAALEVLRHLGHRLATRGRRERSPCQCHHYSGNDQRLHPAS